MNKLFLGLSVALLLLVGVAAAKDAHDRQYLAIQEQYKKDHPGAPFDTKVQQLFPAFKEAKVGDTYRVERCISCHAPDINTIGPEQAAQRLSEDFFKYEPNAAQIAKANGLQSTPTHSAHPAYVDQKLFDAYGPGAVATSDGFHPYQVAGQDVKLPGPLPAFIDPANNGGKPWGIDAVGCVLCHNGSRLALDETHAHQNLIINPEFSWSEGASLYYKYCASCHGSQGEGAIGPPLSNQDRLGFFNEDYYNRCIEYGFTDFEHYGSVMPAWGSVASDFEYDPTRDKQKPTSVKRVLTEDQIALLTQFIRHWESYQTLP